MFGKKKSTRFKNIHDVQNEVRKKLSLQRGEIFQEDIPAEEIRQKIREDLLKEQAKHQKLEQKQEPTKEESRLPSVEEIKRIQGTQPEPARKKVSKTYGDYVPPDTFKHPSVQKKEKQNKVRGRITSYHILDPGAGPWDYIFKLPLVLRRLFVDYRDPIPFLDKLLFIVVFFAAYFLAVGMIMLHYKYIKPDATFTLDSQGRRIEIVVKQEDIPDLRRTLGPDWLRKLGESQLQSK